MTGTLRTALRAMLVLTVMLPCVICGEEIKPRPDQPEGLGLMLERGDWRQALGAATAWSKGDARSAIAAYVGDLARYVCGEVSSPALSQYDFPFSDKKAMKEIETWARSLLTKSPNSPDLLLVNALVYSPGALADVNQLVLLLEKAVVVAPRNSIVLEVLGGAYGAQGKYDLGIETAQKAIAGNPQSSRAYTCLGAAVGKKGDLSNAEQALKKAVEVNKADPWAWFNLGSFHVERGRPTEAEPALQKAVELMPSLLEARWNLGYIHFTSGRRAKAIEQLKSMIGIAPDSPMGKQAKEMLRSLGE